MTSDPVVTNPGLYRVILENERVRVLEYLDQPGDKTTPHRHPDSVMFTLSSFHRRLSSGGREVDVESRPASPGGFPPRSMPARTPATPKRTPSSSS